MSQFVLLYHPRHIHCTPCSHTAVSVCCSGECLITILQHYIVVPFAKSENLKAHKMSPVGALHQFPTGRSRNVWSATWQSPTGLQQGWFYLSDSEVGFCPRTTPGEPDSSGKPLQLSPLDISRVWTTPADVDGFGGLGLRCLHVRHGQDVEVFVMRSASHRANLLAELFGWHRGPDR